MAIDFTFSDEQRMLGDTIYKWASTWLDPQMEHLDEEDKFPPDFFKQLGNLGMVGITIPEQYEGAGLGYTEACICTENLARISNALSMTWGAHLILCADNIKRNANDALKAKYLPGLANGSAMGCLGITEPNAGSDAMSMKTTAKLDGDSWVINGSKIFITNAPGGQTFLFYAKTAPELGPKGISAFVCDIDPLPKGYTCEKIRKFGMRTSPTGLLSFDDMRIPKENLVGELNKGVAILTGGLTTERITLSGCAIGSVRAALELSLKYSQERTQFGKPIAANQMIQEKLANMYVAYETSRLLMYSAAAYVDSLTDKRGGKGTFLDLKAAASLLYAGEVSVKACTDAVQIFGGYGYCLEYPVQRHFRDTKLWDIGAGTSEVRRMIIAREMLSGTKWA